MKTLVCLLLISAGLYGGDSLRVFDRQWSVPVAGDWSVENLEDAPVLRLVQHRGPLPGPRRPIQFALTDVPAYARLTVDADLQPAGKSLMIVFAYRDAAHFDYAHLSTDTGEKQPVHNGIFHVYGGERVRISAQPGPPAFAQSGRWAHVTLMHAAKTGAVSVRVDGREMPSLNAVDRSLGAGSVGLGSFDEAGSFRNVKIKSE